MIQPVTYAEFETQLELLCQGYSLALDAMGLAPESGVLKRFFCSDLSNQAGALEGRRLANADGPGATCAVSLVCQPPPPPAKVALWAYHVSDPAGPLDKTMDEGSLTLRRDGLAHHWTTGITRAGADTCRQQTRDVLEAYDRFLTARNMTMADNVIRTWFFVRNIDANYPEFAASRRQFFAEHGLTSDTHFIASTGIEGAHTDPAAKVTMDAYAISGVHPEQIRFLAAPGHLSPTHIYGVTFERGTSVDYRDRRHTIISGTASIDHLGDILHPGNVSRQFDRTIENMEALLGQAGATLSDMAVFLAYVRDAGDHGMVCRLMNERFGNVPALVVVAPVCRPGWLLEIEGIALTPASNPGMPGF